MIHLTADVIPEYDLGKDPTTIPNPLFGQQTEDPTLAHFPIGGDDLIPKVPAYVSGLYETPDHSSVASFSQSTGTVSHTEPHQANYEILGQLHTPEVPESQIQVVPSFDEYMEKWRLSNTPQTVNNVFMQEIDNILTDPNKSSSVSMTPQAAKAHLPAEALHTQDHDCFLEIINNKSEEQQEPGSNNSGVSHVGLPGEPWQHSVSRDARPPRGSASFVGSSDLIIIRDNTGETKDQVPKIGGFTHIRISQPSERHRTPQNQQTEEGIRYDVTSGSRKRDGSNQGNYCPTHMLENFN